VLADGRVVACDQDVKGVCELGDLNKQTWNDIMQSDRVSELKQAHVTQDFSAFPLCAACNEWHRP
jgi:radical SAM protein with 4Fe4S-binding SPASM domain